MEEVKYIHTTDVHNLEAPQEIVPYLISVFKPQSVVDIGCGLGTFLKVFYERGVQDISGFDGSWVQKEKLFIDERFFHETDLEKKIDFTRKYDLALCLEVGEHLHQQAADVLVDNLTFLSDIIIFSAAVVNQGGQNHINEQPVHYWVEKFLKKGFVFHDVLRSYFWNNKKINWWYRQNMFLVTHDSVDIQMFQLQCYDNNTINEYIHPELLAFYNTKSGSLQKKLNTLLNGNAPGKLYLSLLRKKITKLLFPGDDAKRQ